MSGVVKYANTVAAEVSPVAQERVDICKCIDSRAGEVLVEHLYSISGDILTFITDRGYFRIKALDLMKYSDEKFVEEELAACKQKIAEIRVNEFELRKYYAKNAKKRAGFSFADEMEKQNQLKESEEKKLFILEKLRDAFFKQKNDLAKEKITPKTEI